MSTSRSELTGNIRFRRSRWGKLIVQVEYLHYGFNPIWFVWAEEPRWRDATVEDFEHLPQASLTAEIVDG